MPTGTVRWFDPGRAFGFIAPDVGGNDVFVHKIAVERAGVRTLKQGQKISYDLATDPKKGKATAENLKPV